MHFFILIIGLLIGSFLNVCICRIPEEKSIAFPSSHCPKCLTPLRSIDLIPILSFILNRGRCRYCNEKISFLYPIVEAINGIMYLILYIKFGYSILFIQNAFLISLLIVVFAIDYYHQIIPDGLNILILIFAIIFLGLNNYNSPNQLLSNILGLLAAGGFFLFIAIITKGAMGGGDIKLMAVLGLWFGLKHIALITFLSFLIGGVVSLLIISLKLRGRKDFIPFGPFIVLATTIVMLWGPNILQWYLSYVYS